MLNWKMLESLGQQADGRRVLEKAIDGDKIFKAVWKSAITWYMWIYWEEPVLLEREASEEVHQDQPDYSERILKL